MAQKPVDKEVAHRFAALVGSGLTQHEAARAVEIGTRTGERLMTKPEIRHIVEQTGAARSGVAGEVGSRHSSKPPTRTETRTGSSERRAWSWR